jgi:hypothetical protein
MPCEAEIKSSAVKVAAVNPSNGRWRMADRNELFAFLNRREWTETRIGTFDARIEPDHYSTAKPTHMKFLDVSFATYLGAQAMPITRSFWMNARMPGCGTFCSNTISSLCRHLRLRGKANHRTT